jgi:transglutaminase-like putative cysteine protease
LHEEGCLPLPESLPVSIHVALNHVTHYRYDRRVNLSPQIVRLRPAPHSRTRILGYSLRVEPALHFINWQQDPFANHLARLVFPEPTTEFKVTVDLVAEMSVLNPFDFFLEPEAEHFPFAYAPETKHDLLPYLVKGGLTPRFKAFVDSIPRERTRTIDFLVGLNQRLQREIAYLIRRLLPRHRLAAGADPSPPRAGGALRLGLPHPAQARREGARRPQRR